MIDEKILQMFKSEYFHVGWGLCLGDITINQNDLLIAAIQYIVVNNADVLFDPYKMVMLPPQHTFNNVNSVISLPFLDGELTFYITATEHDDRESLIVDNRLRFKAGDYFYNCSLNTFCYDRLIGHSGYISRRTNPTSVPHMINSWTLAISNFLNTINSR